MSAVFVTLLVVALAPRQVSDSRQHRHRERSFEASNTSVIGLRKVKGVLFSDNNDDE